ncbi:MAG: BatA domain-containing protein [Planctomycetota bacterium]
MSFLNLPLLLGAAAFLIPLWIHLLNRSRFKTVEWGAMHLIALTETDSRRSLDWQSWLLLVMRCAIPILLAIALARPFFANTSGTAGFNNNSERIALALVIDDSLSMASETALDSKSRNAYRAAAIELLQTIGDAEILIVGTSNPYSSRTTLSTLDSVSAINHVQNLDFDAGCCQPLESINFARKWLLETSSSNRQLVVISDWQNTTWQSFQPDPTATDIDGTEDLDRRSRDAAPIATSFWTRNASAQSPTNVAIRIEESAPNQVTQGRMEGQVELPIEIKNWGSEDIEQIPFRCSVDGQDVHQEFVRLSAGESLRRRISVTIKRSGWHYAQCEIELVELFRG